MSLGGAGLILSPVSYPIFWVGVAITLAAGLVFVVMAKLGLHESGH